MSTHKQILTNNMVRLISDLVVDIQLLAHMQQARKFSPENVEIINSKATKQEKNRAFLDILATRGQSAFGVFIKALVETYQDELAYTLHPQLAAKAEQDLGHSVPVQDHPDSYRSGIHQIAQPTEEDTFVPMPDISDKLIPIDVKTITKAEAEKHLKKYNVYPMKRTKRGRVLIISNTDFSEARQKPETRNLENRPPSHIDVSNLRNLFGQLHFEMDEHEDLTAEGIRKRVQKESEHPDHAKGDAFFMFVLSHGTTGKIYGTDGETISKDDIIAPFSQDKCRGLYGKPKVFIFQACQGAKTTTGVPSFPTQEGGEDGGQMLTSASGRSASMNPGKSTHDGGDVMDAMPENRPAAEPMDTGIPGAGGPREHELANILDISASVPGYVSFKDDNHGSWMIRAFVFEVNRSAHRKHLIDIISDVQEQVKRKFTNACEIGADHNIQCLSYQSLGFNKHLYFLPGYSCP